MTEATTILDVRVDGGPTLSEIVHSHYNCPPAAEDLLLHLRVWEKSQNHIIHTGRERNLLLIVRALRDLGEAFRITGNTPISLRLNNLATDITLLRRPS